MSRKSETKSDTERAPRPTRAQRLVAAGFLGAFGLTIITVILTGLEVRSASSRRAADTRPVATAPQPAPDAGVSSPDAGAAARDTAPRVVDSGHGENAGKEPAHEPDAGETPAHGADAGDTRRAPPADEQR